MSSALEAFREWNSSGKSLFLFDTFLPYFTGKDGIQKKENGINKLYYASSQAAVRKNFSKWDNIEFRVGNVFDSINPCLHNTRHRIGSAWTCSYANSSDLS
jgi:hypothetical protein